MRQPYFKVCLPPAMKEWLRARADRNCRSIGSEIVFLLELARLGIAPPPEQPSDPAAGEPAKP